MLVSKYNCTLKLPWYSNSVLPWQCDVMKYLSITTIKLQKIFIKLSSIDGSIILWPWPKRPANLNRILHSVQFSNEMIWNKTGLLGCSFITKSGKQLKSIETSWHVLVFLKSIVQKETKLETEFVTLDHLHTMCDCRFIAYYCWIKS